MANIANMTLEDLKALIAEVVNEHMGRWQRPQSDDRTTEQVLTTMDQLRWTPPAGSPSTTDLLREDRDR